MTEAKRRRELSLGPVGPWAALITVDAVETNHGRHSSLPHDWLFEVRSEWFGPPAIGFPASREPVQGTDVCVVTTLDEAREMAQRAAAAFRAGGDEAPDLRDFLQRRSGAWIPRDF